MHGSPRVATRSAGPARRAVVWIEPGRALVVRGGDGEELASVSLDLPGEPDDRPTALAGVARAIGEVDRVLVVGEDDLRTALEREIVAIGHRPDTIREATMAAPVDEAALVARLRRLPE